MSLYFQEHPVLQMRRDTVDSGRLLTKQSVRSSHTTISQTTKSITRNPKDGKITIGFGEAGALGGRKIPSQGSLFRRENGGISNTLTAGMAALTSPTLEWKDVYRQAENLFLKGEYEQALVWYHRGRRLRPKAREFTTGISKCERAIENRCAIPPTIQFNSLNASPVQSGMESFISDSSGEMSPSNTATSRTSTRMTSISGGSTTIQTVRSLPTPHVKTDTSPIMRREKSFENEDITGDQERKHLRKLKRDKMYLRDLLREMDNNINNTEVQNIVEESLKYLDTRSKFWKQQIPLHAIRALQNRQFPFPVNSLSVRDDSSLPSVNNGISSREGKRESSGSNINHYILREVFKVHQDFLDGRYKECIARTDRCLQTIQIHKSTEVGRKFEVVASLHGVKGNSYFQLENYKEALRCYYKDLEIAKERELSDARSRALENIGRVYARVGEFDKAVQVWKEKSALCKSDSERTWLYHEIGYCYLSKREFSRAKQFGEMSYASAEHVGDLMWQLNSTVLIAQAEARLDDLLSAHDTFRYALDLAKLVGDKDEQQNIMEAITGLKKAITEEKEEKRRRSLEMYKAKKKKSPMNNILTDEDLWIDDWDGFGIETPDILEESRSNPQHLKGNERRRRNRPPYTHRSRQSKDGESTEYGSSRSESRVTDVTGLSLHGGGVTLRERHSISPIKGFRQEDYKEGVSAMEQPPDAGTETPKPRKGILKNSNIPDMYYDLDPDDGHFNTHLLPAIAHSNLQIGNVKADLSNIIVNIPIADNDEEEIKKQKQVRFKDENETFKLPEVPPPSDATTDADDLEQLQPQPRLLMRPVLEIDGYFIGKYA